jgi:hypothetical protein
MKTPEITLKTKKSEQEIIGLANRELIDAIATVTDSLVRLRDDEQEIYGVEKKPNEYDAMREALRQLNISLAMRACFCYIEKKEGGEG